jgi:hypothetical protein
VGILLLPYPRDLVAAISAFAILNIYPMDCEMSAADNLFLTLRAISAVIFVAWSVADIDISYSCFYS